MTTNGTSFLDLQPGDERAYDAMAQAVLEAILKLLARMEAEASAHPYQEITLEVFQSLIDHVDEFVEQCCAESAKVMRQCAVLPEVRAVPTVVLANEIRREVFGAFTRHQETWEGLKLELEPFLAKLKDGSLPYSERLRGSRAWEEHEAKLMASLETALRRFDQIPDQLLDYCCARCLGSQVCLNHQAKAVETVQGKVTESLEKAVRLVIDLSVVKNIEHQDGQKCERCIPASTVSGENKGLLVKGTGKWKLEFPLPRPASGILMLAISAGLFLWSLRCFDFDHGSDAKTAFSIVLFIAGGFAFGAGIITLFRRGS